MFGTQRGSCNWQWYAVFCKLVTGANPGQARLDITTAGKAGSGFGHGVIGMKLSIYVTLISRL